MRNHVYFYKANVTRVIDGDTIECLVDLGFNISIKERFRLKNIDTPEIYFTEHNDEYEKGIEAKNKVEELVLNKDVIIESSNETGSYNRYLINCFITDNFEEISVDNLLNTILLENGLAEEYTE